MVATRPEFDITQVRAIAVEDNSASAAMIGVIMRRLGMDSMVDPTGSNVVHMAVKTKPDVIFCDLNLPNTSGFEILKQIRQHRVLDNTRVVAVTAVDPHIGIPRCKEAGFDGFIAKPLTRRQFKTQVERLMTGKDVWDSR